MVARLAFKHRADSRPMISKMAADVLLALDGRTDLEKGYMFLIPWGFGRGKAPRAAVFL